MGFPSRQLHGIPLVHATLSAIINSLQEHNVDVFIHDQWFQNKQIDYLFYYYNLAQVATKVDTTSLQLKVQLLQSQQIAKKSHKKYNTSSI